MSEMAIFRQLTLQYGSSLAFQTFHDFLGILWLDSHFFQSCAKMLEEQVEVRIVQTVISGAGVGVMNILPCIHSSAEEHRNEHHLPGPEVRHVNSLEELAQAIILQDLVIEEFSSSLDSAASPNQVKQVFNHCVLAANECYGDFSPPTLLRVDLLDNSTIAGTRH
jgi:hypothetical protein